MKKKALTPLEKQLATALFRIWDVLPFDLSEVPTEYTDQDEGSEAVAKAHEQAMNALLAAEKAGWKKPRPLPRKAKPRLMEKGK